MLLRISLIAGRRGFLGQALLPAFALRDGLLGWHNNIIAAEEMSEKAPKNPKTNSSPQDN